MAYFQMHVHMRDGRCYIDELGELDQELLDKKINNVQGLLCIRRNDANTWYPKKAMDLSRLISPEQNGQRVHAVVIPCEDIARVEFVETLDDRVNIVNWAGDVQTIQTVPPPQDSIPINQNRWR